MKIGICQSEYGHFLAVNVEDKEKTLEMLKTFDGGDMWANEWHHLYNTHFGPLAWTCNNKPEEDPWKNFLDECSHQRGLFEIVEV